MKFHVLKGCICDKCNHKRPEKKTCKMMLISFKERKTCNWFNYQPKLIKEVKPKVVSINTKANRERVRRIVVPEAKTIYFNDWRDKLEAIEKYDACWGRSKQRFKIKFNDHLTPWTKFKALKLVKDLKRFRRLERRRFILSKGIL